MYFLFGYMGHCLFRNLACKHLNIMIKLIILLINMYICRVLSQNTLKKSYAFSLIGIVSDIQVLTLSS